MTVDRRFSFYGLCAAVVLERSYHVYQAATMSPQGPLDREAWFKTGNMGRRALAIAGLEVRA